MRLWLVRNRRAQRYVLRLRPDGAARVTIPRGGSAGRRKRFAEKNAAWLERQLLRQAAQPAPARARGWPATEILFRGERVRIEAGAKGEAGLGSLWREFVRVADADWRPPPGH